MRKAIGPLVLALALLTSCASDNRSDAERAYDELTEQPLAATTSTVPPTPATTDPAVEALKARLAGAEATGPYRACAQFAATHTANTRHYELVTPGYWETDKFTFKKSGSDGLVIRSTVTRYGVSTPYACLVSKELPRDRTNGYECSTNHYCLIAFEGEGYTLGYVPQGT